MPLGEIPWPGLVRCDCDDRNDDAGYVRLAEGHLSC